MNGVHDLGGMDGFGPVDVETDEPVFHHAWERRVFGLTAVISASRVSNTHTFRHAIERMEPTHYLASSYYEHWLTALATILVEKGMITRAELDQAVGGTFALSRPQRGGAAAPPAASAAPRYSLGSAVRVRNLHPLGHTRCPRYVRGRLGVVTRVDRPFPLPDVAAHSSPMSVSANKGGQEGACKEYSYGVRFSAAELWGDAANPTDTVHVDLWESYLEAP